LRLTNGRVFVISALAGAACVVSYHWLAGPASRQKPIRQIDRSGIYISDQLRESDFQRLIRLHIATVVDMRPDGEATDQVSSEQVAAISKEYGIAFEYIPIPHGDIPAAGVNRLSSVLTDGKRPILLYCRTGKRAVRTYCLAEASRIGGHNAEELESIADQTGFSIKDLQLEIARRIAARGTE
jgi:uncharacterized protein (TIGR01244 family)